MGVVPEGDDDPMVAEGRNATRKRQPDDDHVVDDFEVVEEWTVSELSVDGGTRWKSREDARRRNVVIFGGIKTWSFPQEPEDNDDEDDLRKTREIMEKKEEKENTSKLSAGLKNELLQIFDSVFLFSGPSFFFQSCLSA